VCVLLVALELLVVALIVAPRWVARKLVSLIRPPATRTTRPSPILAASRGVTSLTGRSLMPKNSTIVACPNCGTRREHHPRRDEMS
jgi:hypothetical protein